MTCPHLHPISPVSATRPVRHARIHRIAIVATLLIVGMAAWFTVGCSEVPTTTADGRTILTFWHMYNDQEEAVLLEIVADFEKTHPKLKINPVRIPFDGHKPKIRTALTVEKAPDMARVDWSFVCELARKQALVELDSMGFRDRVADYLPAAVGTNLIDGKYYGVPDQTTGVALFYNKELFRAAGLDPEKPPKTWAEFVEVGKKLTKAEAGQYAFAMDNTLWWTLPFFNTFGAPLISEDGKQCLLDGASATMALEFKASLYKEHKIEAGAWRPGSISPESGFVNKKFAMIFMGPWNLPKFAGAGLDFGVSLIPAGPCGTSTNVGGTDIVVFKTSKHPKEVYEFLLFLTSGENQARWCQKLQQIPVNLKAYDKVKLDDPKLGVFLEQMKSARPNPIVTNYGDLEELVNPEMEAVLTGQKIASEALSTAARKVEKKVLNPS